MSTDKLKKGISRRTFLLTSAGTFGATIFSGCKSTPQYELFCSNDGTNSIFEFILIRDKDNFSAFIEIHGFCLTKFGNKPYLKIDPDVSDQDRLLVFRFPPQHFAETALSKSSLDKLNNSNWDKKIDGLLEELDLIPSKISKMVFRIPRTRQALPKNKKAMPLDIEHLLSWDKFDYVLENSLNPYIGDLGPLDSNRRRFFGLETWKGKGKKQTSAIDLPSGFYLQPSESIRYENGVALSKPETFTWKTTVDKADGGFYKNWAAFMVPVGVDRSQKLNFELIDIWGIAGDGNEQYVNVDKRYEYYDPTLGHIDPNSIEDSSSSRLYRDTPLDFYDRIELAITLSPRLNDKSETLSYRPDRPDDECGNPPVAEFNSCYAPDHYLTASTYGISSDGGWLDISGTWNVAPGCTVKGWLHKTVRGRDTQVKVLRVGCLYNFGFKVELVQETRREYLRDSNAHLVAPLVKEIYIRAVKPSNFMALSIEEGFKDLKLVTERTPSLDVEELYKLHKLKHKELDAFVPRVNGENYHFEIEGIDHSGKKVSWSMPLIFISNRLTTIEYKGGYPENPNKPIPSNTLKVKGVEDNHFIIAGSNGVCTPKDKAIDTVNVIKLIDSIWERLPYRFASLNGEVISLAQPRKSGDSSCEVNWIEWVRGRVPTLEDYGKEEKQYLPFTMVPRIRTLRFSLQGMRQFSGVVPGMIGTFRDLRLPFKETKSGFVAKPLALTLDPEETQTKTEYEVGLLNPNQTNNAAGSYLCVLPVIEKSGEEDGNPVGIAKIVGSYYPNFLKGVDFKNKDYIKASLFSGMNNFVKFANAKSNEGLGGLSSPDSPIALLTQVYGPQGDSRQNIEELDTNLKAANKLYSNGLQRLTSNNTDLTSGVINLGIDSIFGKSAEIIPGIQYSQVINYIFQSGGNSNPNAVTMNSGQTEFLSKNSGSPSGGNGLQWQTHVTGLDWVLNLIGSGPTQISTDDFISILLAKKPSENVGSPLSFGIESRLDWETRDFKPIGIGVFQFTPHPENKKTRFKVSASASLDLVEAKPKMNAYSEFSNFGLTFFNAISVIFTSISFEMHADGSKEFKPHIGNISFSGPLTFVNGIQTLLSGLGDEYGIDLKISPERVSVSQRLSFPPGDEPKVINIGPASISNLFFTWGVKIPILGRDTISVTASLASRETPMTISVGIYGGRCYVLTEANVHGLRHLELSTDYGGVFQAEWGGIAKGSCSLTAGFFYSISNSPICKKSNISFYAFVQFSGQLRIASIFSASTNVMVALGFKGGCDSDVIFGLAKCSVSFKIIFKKFKYSYQVYRQETTRGSSTEQLSFSPDQSCEIPLTEDQKQQAGYFKPFKDYGDNVEWQEYFDGYI
jgi:hypothetical protein